MELCRFNKEDDCAISLGLAVIDKWLEMNEVKVDSRAYDVQELKEIINDREKLYRNYFQLFDDENSIDQIRIFYPQNGESWIRWDDSYSIDIKVNLSKGLEYGFCREGFDYCRILSKEKPPLRLAYVLDDKEVLRFDSASCDKNGTLIWVR